MFKQFSLIASSLLIFQSANAAFQWTQKSSFGGPGRHRLVSCSVGSKGYMGLGHINATIDVVYDDWWEFDPASNSWTQKANYPGGMTYNGVAFSIGNLAYCGTGINTSFQNKDEFFSYNPATNSWLPIADYGGGPRRGCVAFVIQNLGYVATGSFMNDIWSYDPSTDSWTPHASCPGVGRAGAVGFEINGKGYVGTGSNSSYYPLYDFWEFDPTLNTWLQKANFPAGRRTQGAGFSLLSRGYLGCGMDSVSNDYNDFWRYNPTGDSWTQVVDFGGSARRYLSCFTIQFKAYGGCGTNGINLQDFWDYGSLTDSPDMEEDEISLNVFPNPVSTFSTVKINNWNSKNDMSLKLFDVTGKWVMEKKVTDNEMKLECGIFPSGVYFLQISEKNKPIASSKIIIE